MLEIVKIKCNWTNTANHFIDYYDLQLEGLVKRPLVRNFVVHELKLKRTCPLFILTSSEQISSSTCITHTF
jgi:hypothetical protein